MILTATIRHVARFNLDQVNKKANAIQDEIKQKMKVPTNSLSARQVQLLIIANGCNNKIKLIE